MTLAVSPSGESDMYYRHIIFYRHFKTGAWRGYARQTVGFVYSRPSDWLTDAEEAMRGSYDLLNAKRNERANHMIWC